MGVGYAVDLVVCVALGVDMFDCVVILFSNLIFLIYKSVFTFLLVSKSNSTFWNCFNS